MLEWPTGTVTFLFTDIEDGTPLAQQYPAAIPSLLDRHNAIVRASVDQNGGRIYQVAGDGYVAAFGSAVYGLAAALAAQRALQSEPWDPAVIRVRMGLHTGEAEASVSDDGSLLYSGYLTLTRAQRVMAAAHGGQVLLSAASSGLMSGQLPDGVRLRDLGEHRLKGLVTAEHLWQAVAAGLAADFPPLSSPEATAHNLPAQVTSFVGREKEIAEIKQLLAGTRLLTLTGSGGAGKTRLALQVAGELLGTYADGVWLVELAAVSDPSLIAQAIASALEMRDEARRPLLETLRDYLHGRELLLVLDNCEHLIDDAARLADSLLRSAPRLKILATSREPLAIAGEITYRVPSLRLADPHALPPVASLLDYEAIRLFVERAALAQPGFALTDANAAAVVEICARLDGIPLAIELAAARVRSLPVEQIRARLGDRFHLLTAGSRAALPRQQTLRATVDWSYALLSEPEQALFRRLAVFAGGWAAEATEAIGGPADDFLDLQTRLVDKSLVLVDSGPNVTRYRMLETVHEYAAERLAESGERAAARQSHAAYFLALAQEAEPHLGDASREAWLARLADDDENLRVALAHLREDGQPGPALAMAGALWRFWEVRGGYAEARAQLAELLAQAGTAASASARAKALLAAGAMAYYQGDYEWAGARCAEALAIYRGLEDRAGVAWTLVYQGWAAVERGDYAAARALLGESLAIARALGDRQAAGSALSRLAMAAAYEGDYAPAKGYLDEGVPLFRQLGDKMGLAQALTYLGLVLMQLRDFEAAQAADEESFALCHELGYRRGQSFSVVLLAFLYLQRGLVEAALPLMKEGLANFREMGDRFGAVMALAGMALLAGLRSQPELAVRLAAAAAAQHRAIGGIAPAGLTVLLERVVGSAAQALGDRAGAIQAEGGALTLDQAGVLALEQV
jgi:predicted ATPase/class 3 adenylate cyclase